MENRVYIEPETINKAAENSHNANRKALDTIKNGTPDDIRQAVAESLERSRDYRAYICANYNIKYR